MCGTGFAANGVCKDPAGHLWDPYSGVYDANKGGPVRSTIIPFNNVAKYDSPGSPKLAGTPIQLAPGAGNIFDPRALNIRQDYPLPHITVRSASDNSFAHIFQSYF